MTHRLMSHAVAIMLAFVSQAAPDIMKCRKERLAEQSIQDPVRATERVFNHRKLQRKEKECVRRQEEVQGRGKTARIKRISPDILAWVRQGS